MICTGNPIRSTQDKKVGDELGMELLIGQVLAPDLHTCVEWTGHRSGTDSGSRTASRRTVEQFVCGMKAS